MLHTEGGYHCYQDGILGAGLIFEYFGLVANVFAVCFCYAIFIGRPLHLTDVDYAVTPLYQQINLGALSSSVRFFLGSDLQAYSVVATAEMPIACFSWVIC